MAPVGMSFSLLIEDQGLIEVHFLSSQIMVRLTVVLISLKELMSVYFKSL